MQNKISSIVTQTLPEFIQNDNELFTLFIKYYFEWMETQDNFLNYIEKHQSNMNLDLADEPYIDMFIQDFASIFPKNLYNDGDSYFSKKELTKSIREFYLAKGSESSIRFIFNLLHNTDIEFYYPREILQKSSNCVWDSIDYAYCTANNFSDLTIKEDSNIFAQGLESGKTMIIDKITTAYFGTTFVMKLFISSYELGFIIGESIELTVDDVAIVEETIGCLDELNVIDGGSGYTLEDNIDILDSETGQLAIAKINKLSNGGYESFTIESSGTGYIVGELIYTIKQLDNTGFGFIAEIMEIGGAGEILNIRIINTGLNYSKIGISNIVSTNGINSVIKFTGDEIGKIESILVYDSGSGYINPNTITLNIDSILGSGLTVEPKTSVVFVGVNRHLTQLDFPSNHSRVQDGHLYQNFSYVIMSNISPHKWIDEIKRIVHPAGTIVFGLYRLESYVESILSLVISNEPIIRYSITIEGVSTNIHMPMAGIQVIELNQVNENQKLGLLHFDLDNTKLQNSWQGINYFDYTLDGIQDRVFQESKQEDAQLDVVYIYNNTTTYSIGQLVLYTDGNTYRNLIESTGTPPPLIGTWEIESYSSYNNTIEYSLNDAVIENSIKYIYINVTPSTGNTPPNITYWALV